MVGIECADNDRAEAAVRSFRERAKVEAVVLTRGADGMTIFDPAEVEGAVTHVPAVASQVFDVSGAGDTVVAALALALGSGASVTTAARIGNAAAGIAVSKRGTAVVHAEELSAVLGGATTGREPKIVSNEAASAIVADWKAKGLKVGADKRVLRSSAPRACRTSEAVARRLRPPRGRAQRRRLGSPT